MKNKMGYLTISLLGQFSIFPTFLP